MDLLDAVTPSQRWGAKERELADLRICKGLTRSEIRVLTRNLDQVDIEAGAVLTVENERNEAFWIVSEGILTVSVARLLLRHLGRGDFVGGHSFLHGGRSAATVMAWTAARMFIASRQQFMALCSVDLLRLRLQALAGARFYEDFRLLTGLGPNGLSWLARNCA